MALTLDDFDYALPPQLIAQHPLPERTQSRLLYLSGESITDHVFAGLPELLAPGDLVVMNDTRVLKARLFGVKQTGGRAEVLIERLLDDREALAQIRASHAPKPGSRLNIGAAFDLLVLERSGGLYRVRFEGLAAPRAGTGAAAPPDHVSPQEASSTSPSPARPAPSDAAMPAVPDAAALLDRYGQVPLPPYVTHAPGAVDIERYQTVYARAPGAVAAPTAGLHFDDALLGRLRQRGIDIATLTLHVGAGTFKPVRVADLREHHMHSERYSIPAHTARAIEATRARGGRIVSIGTTTLRALESWARSGMAAPHAGETDLFIMPGFPFRIVDRLVTNFHLPCSTLLMLVSAFAGMAPIRAAYRHAIAERYRFFSYGDAMLIDRHPVPGATGDA